MEQSEAGQRPLTVLFLAGAAEVFASLPWPVRTEAARRIELAKSFPLMYPRRCRGLMAGYRYFVIARILFYYQVSSDQIRVCAILPGAMRRS